MLASIQCLRGCHVQRDRLHRSGTLGCILGSRSKVSKEELLEGLQGFQAYRSSGIPLEVMTALSRELNEVTFKAPSKNLILQES